MENKSAIAPSASLHTPEDIYIFLLPTHAWDIWVGGAYKHITDEMATSDWAGSPVPACTFRTRSEGRVAYAFRTDAKRIDYTAAVTKAILDHFSTPDRDGVFRYRVDCVVLIGFCGTLKGDEFKLGDLGVASQIDCYMEKAKIADGRIDLCGEIYRTTLEYIRIAQNLRYLDPDGYETFRHEAILTRSVNEMIEAAREHLPTDSIAIHTPHLASATLLSTTRSAVEWVRDRDRKLFMIDMESGGMMAAVWAHNQSHGASKPIKTLIVRAAADFTDETRDKIKSARKALQTSGVHNVCRFVDWMFRFMYQTLPTVPLPDNIDVGIVVPLEEEFRYFVEQIRHMNVPLTPHYDPREGRFSYSFTLQNVRCACTFVGDMGLAQMALTTDAMLNTYPSTRLMILVGIAGSISPDILVCDVALATNVDPYLQGAPSNMETMGPLSSVYAEPILIDEALQVFEHTKEDIRRSYEEMLREVEEIPEQLKHMIRDPASIMLHNVPFASGDAVAADKKIHGLLRSGERWNSIVEMEAAGMQVATALRTAPPPIRTLFFRGISDNASGEKQDLDQIKPAGILRKIAMKNASSLVLHLLRSERLLSAAFSASTDFSPPTSS